jgi:hypothetical protein
MLDALFLGLKGPDDLSISRQTEAYTEARDCLLIIFKVPAPCDSPGYYFRNRGVQRLVESDLDEFTRAHGNVPEKHYSFGTDVYQLRLTEYLRLGLFDHHCL